MSLFTPFRRGPATAQADVPPVCRMLHAERTFTAAVALFALFLFSLTLARGVCPCESGAATAQALGLLPSAIPEHPLWLLAARGVARLPLPFDVVLRLNAFSALCGSLAAALLFRLARRLLAEVLRDPPSIRLVPSAADALEEALDGGGVPEEVEQQALCQAIATAGGLIAAAVFAFSLPVWHASTALHPQMFDTLLLLATADHLACYHYTGNIRAAVAAAFLLGLGLVESAAGWLLAPLAAFLFLRDGVRFDHISESFVLLILGLGLAGAAANAGLLAALSDLTFANAAVQAQPLLAGAVGGLWRDLLAVLPRHGWALVAFQTLVPPLVAAFSLCSRSPLQDENTRWRWAVMNLLSTVFVAACLMSGCDSFGVLAEGDGRLSTLPSLSLAAAAGALAAYWCALATECRPGPCAERPGPAYSTRLLGFSLCGLLAFAALRALHLNAPLADARKGDFADRVADAVLAAAGPARCLLIDGLIDMNLLVRNHLSGQPRAILKTGLEPASATGAKQDFIARWLRANPGREDQVAAVAEPRVWLQAGLRPVPYGLIYRGEPAAGGLSVRGLADANRAFWDRVSPLLDGAPGDCPAFANLRARLRDRLSRAANDFGVAAERLGDTRAAEEAYTRALGLNATNVCALLNRYSLRLRQPKPGDCGADDDELQLHSMAAQNGFAEQVLRASAETGALAPRDADTLLPAMVRDCAASGRPAGPLLKLADPWLSAARPAPPRAAALTPSAQAPAAPVDLRVARAFALRLNGQPAAAERLLRLVVKSRPASLTAWSLLAELLLNRGALDEVEHTVLPALRQACPHNDSSLADLTEGCLRLRARPPQLNDARACFRAAFQARPDLPEPCAQLLATDRRIAQAAWLEEDASLILRLAPTGAAARAEAHALLGSLRLSQRRQDEAERHLRQSVTEAPAAPALNDLAELLRQRGQLAAAECQARQALRLTPSFYQAWDTLGNALLDAGRTLEAADALSCALAFCPAGDVRPQLSLARVCIKDGRLAEAVALLDRLAPLSDRMPSSTRLDYAGLRRQADAPPRPD